MAVYTIPKGKVGFLVRGEVGLEFESNTPPSSEFVQAYYKSRRYGRDFSIGKLFSIMVAQGTYVDDRSVPDPIPSLTDIKIGVKSISANMGVWGAFDILLFDETMFPVNFLKSITQPGY